MEKAIRRFDESRSWYHLHFFNYCLAANDNSTVKMKLCFTANVLIFETNDAVKNDLKVTKTSQTIQSNPFRFVALAFLFFFFFGGGEVTNEIKSN